MRFLPSRRAILVSVLFFVLGVAIGSGVTASATISHYRSEHAVAARDRAQHASLIHENSELQRTLTQREATAARLQSQLGRARADLSYAVRQWTKSKSRTASLRAKLDLANASAKSSYRSGYDQGYSDASGSISTGSTTSSSGGCDSNYEGACVPTGYGDVDCSEVDGADFYVVGVDVDGLDGDGDGIACES